MNAKFSRRRIVAAALGSAAALRADPAPAVQQPEDAGSAAKERLRKNAETLGKVDLPMSTEPAFLFKA